jgi:hypothetical protein
MPAPVAAFSNPASISPSINQAARYSAALRPAQNIRPISCGFPHHP